MKRFQSLKFAIPLVLFISCGILSTLAAIYDYRKAHKEIFDHETGHINHLMTRLQFVVEKDIRRDNIIGIREEVSRFSPDPNLKVAIIADHKEQIIASTKTKLIAHSLSTYINTLPTKSQA